MCRGAERSSHAASFGFARMPRSPRTDSTCRDWSCGRPMYLPPSTRVWEKGFRDRGWFADAGGLDLAEGDCQWSLRKIATPRCRELASEAESAEATE
ncbi:hypothetical protein RHCRD62_40573 [Rhodococcus sp. RD6.2]|nr:hypothetical protein RHCRD62_40573 [Rhodococcus sp. RD6.2]